MWIKSYNNADYFTCVSACNFHVTRRVFIDQKMLQAEVEQKK
jgi:hypothetical protein